LLLFSLEKWFGRARLPRGRQKFPGLNGFTRSTAWRVFEQESVPVIYLCNANGAQNKGQLLKGSMLEKMLRTTA